jgi:MSHA pilin protein MshA
MVLGHSNSRPHLFMVAFGIEMMKQKGFTLIELVVVMVILGILAAFAIPRFYDFRSQANIAILNGLAGALSSGNVTAHGAALATNTTGATGTITMEGGSVSLAFGYPAGSAAGIGNAIRFSSTSYGVAYASGIATYTVTGAATPANCSIRYTQPASAGVAGVVSAVTTSGC